MRSGLDAILPLRYLLRAAVLLAGAYILWILASTLAPSERIAGLVWYPLIFLSVVATSRLGRRGAIARPSDDEPDTAPDPAAGDTDT